MAVGYHTDPDGAARTLRAINMADSDGHTVQLNLASIGSCLAAVADVVQHFGRLDLSVNNAARDPLRPYWPTYPTE